VTGGHPLPRSHAGQGRSVTVVWDVEPDVAYATVSDVVAGAAHSDEVVDVAWHEGVVRGRPVAGDRFTARNRALGVTWTSTSTVVDAEPGRRFAFVVGSQDTPTAVWSFDLEPVPGRGTRVTYAVVLGSGPSMLDTAAGLDPDRYAALVRGRLDHLERAMTATLTAMTPRDGSA
jgi:hypothetical protein